MMDDFSQAYFLPNIVPIKMSDVCLNQSYMLTIILRVTRSRNWGGEYAMLLRIPPPSSFSTILTIRAVMRDFSAFEGHCASH